jgi:hypothetical protein
MKPALVAAALFFLAIMPGLVNHGTPLPHSGSNVAQAAPAQAGPARQAPRPGLLQMVTAWKNRRGWGEKISSS